MTNESKGGDKLCLVAKWKGTAYELQDLDGTTTILEVKTLLESQTNVLVKRQKLMGLNVAGRPAADECVLSQVDKLKNPHKFILMGTPEAEIFVDPESKEDLPEVFDDFDLDVTSNSQDWIRAIENSENLNKFTEATQVHFINPPRPGKFLLVCDLDHTLLDFSTRETSMEALKRPHMDAFLAAVYEHYDLAIWSQTSWRWLEIKLTELGMLTNPHYRICFVLDKTNMFHVTSTLKNGQEKRHQVKPLKIIWSKFDRWHANNTAHIDDLSQNFALNPSSGVKVSAYYRKKDRALHDMELVLLARYLIGVVLRNGNEGFSGVDHKNWKEDAQNML